MIVDAPPLGCAGAAAAGIPSVVVSNFTWDWIYARIRRVRVGARDHSADPAGLRERPAPHGGCPSMAASRSFHDDRRRALRRAARPAQPVPRRAPRLACRRTGASRSFRSAATASPRSTSEVWTACSHWDVVTTGVTFPAAAERACTCSPTMRLCARPALRRSGRGVGRGDDQAGIRHRLRMRGKRGGHGLHLAGPFAEYPVMVARDAALVCAAPRLRTIDCSAGRWLERARDCHDVPPRRPAPPQPTVPRSLRI